MSEPLETVSDVARKLSDDFPHLAQFWVQHPEKPEIWMRVDGRINTFSRFGVPHVVAALVYPQQDEDQ